MIVNPNDDDVARLYFDNQMLVWTPDILKFSCANDLQKFFPVHEVTKFKKLKSKDALAPINRTMKGHALSIWTQNVDAAGYMQRILRITENEIRHCVRDRWFKDLRLGSEVHSWRYTVTKDEPLHFDVYADRVQNTVIRIFANLDNEPRVWDVASINYRPEDGKWDQMYKAIVLKGVPVTRVEFPPGSIWAVNSQRMAHAIIYGRRAAMFSWETIG